MATLSEWIDGARPRTLPAAVAPVAVGTGLAASVQSFVFPRALLALVVAVALQVGVNYANDYSDGVRGTDERRVGPVRLVGQGLAAPRQVLVAAILSFTIAALAGLVLVLLTEQLWLFIVGAVSIAAAWFYTGGPRPYGYAGLGEFFVFIFFGIIPVLGTQYVQSLSVNLESLIAAIGVGALACAILVANNLRDIPTDTEHDKKTLAVRLGDDLTRKLYSLLVMVSLSAPILITLNRLSEQGDPTQTTNTISYNFSPLMAVLAFGFIGKAYRDVWEGASGPDLIPVLKSTGEALLAYGLLLGVGLALGVPWT